MTQIGEPKRILRVEPVTVPQEIPAEVEPKKVLEPVRKV